jgi:aerobic C4-dicarboxylate transport protein
MKLYLRVLIATIVGALFGWLLPDTAENMLILGESFIALIKMIIGPVIFCTIVLGISGSGDMKKAGRVGGLALLYFEIVSTVALGLGLVMVNWLKPGSGFGIDPAMLDPAAVAEYTKKAADVSALHIFRGIIPSTFTDAFSASGNLLQVLLIALLFGYALKLTGPAGEKTREWIQSVSHILFKIVHLIMQLAPIGAFGAMSFTVGKYGLKSFGPLFTLMGTFYLTCLIFIFLVLGGIARLAGMNIFRFIGYIREELLTVLGTSSSESVLAPLMEKLEALGCSQSTVGLVVPAGYSFNLDGTNIYLTMAAVFVAQALGIDLSWREQLTLLLVATVTSKGASGVTGSGFVTLAATFAAVPSVPVAGLALILGIDRFMSEARALTNTIGNGVATVVLSRWEGELTREQLTAGGVGASPRAPVPHPAE